MTGNGFLDTNILLYSISRVEHERPKREIALSLLHMPHWTLSVQVLQEFYVQATRPASHHAIPHEYATRLIHAWMRFRIQDNTAAVLQRALAIKATHGFSYWDSSIIAAALAAGCRTIHTEDMTHGRQIEGVTLINPFRDP